jgi:LmbE family N-acetylglucosaminyl deacetylase
MAKKLFFLFGWAILIFGYAIASPGEISALEPIKKNDRILILAPHPDDETLGCAGIIQEAIKQGADIRVVYLTNGDHNQFAFIVYEKRLTLKKGEFIHLGEVRHKEAIKAMQLLGLNENNLTFLGYPDFGTFTIFCRYWQESKPFKSLLTHISAVPYKENLSFGAPYKGESILSDLKQVLLTYKPNKIFVSHPADTNVDHKSFYLFLQVALADLEKEIPRPQVYPYLIHCVGWPLPRHYHPELSLEPPEKFSGSQINWSKFMLTAEQLDKKHQAILCYKSQTETSAFYLLAFGRKNELFGDYPEIKISPAQTIPPQEVQKSVTYTLIDNSLLICIPKPKNLEQRFIVLLYLFGYNYKIPFAQMPKIRIITKYNKFKVFDGRKTIKSEDINLELNTETLILKIPLKILGEPDFILTVVKIYHKILSMGPPGFRKIKIK